MKLIKITKYTSQFFRRLLYIIQAHLFISIVSLPILVHWGLPISAMSVVGNIIFGPFLTSFLLLSSLVFFFEIVHLPNCWLIKLIDFLTNWWTFFMKTGKSSWLIAFPSFVVPFLWFMVLASIAIILHPKTKSVNRSTACLFFLIISSTLILKNVHNKPMEMFTIQLGRQYLDVIHSDNQTVLIDPGVLGRTPSQIRQIEYKVIPEIIKKTGLLKIDHLIILKTQKLLPEAIETLQQKMLVKKIYLTNNSQQLLENETNIELITQNKVICLGKYCVEIKQKPFSEVLINKKNKTVKIINPPYWKGKKISTQKN